MYKIEELDLKNDSEEEQIRTREIFENIKERCKKGEPVSEHEKDFFGLGVKLSLKDDGKIEDYSCCDNYKFKMIYLSYYHDLSGKGEYEKVKGKTIYKVGEREKKTDISYLSQVASSWQNVINITNHSNELLKQISKETREELKEVEKNKGMLIFRRDKERYQLNKRRILLQSKYIYCTALLIFEMFENKDFVFNVNGQDIEINEYSIIHILNRHFSEVTKQNFNKSYHGEDIKPKYLNKQLKEIMTIIDESKHLDNQNINNINFRYKGVDYAIWINKRMKQEKGKGNVEYNRLETFYPIKNKEELEKLNDEYDYRQINNDIGVYVKKVLNK
jgi:hypothetical protein